MGLIKDIKLQKSDDGYEIITQNSYGYGDIIRTMAYAKSIKYLIGSNVSIRYVIEPSVDALMYKDILHNVLQHYITTCIPYTVEICRLEKYAHRYVNFLRKEHAKIVSEKIGHPKLIPVHQSFNLEYLCVWTPWNNLAPVDHDKMPINKDTFNSFIKELDIPVKMVDYRMPVDYVFETIRHSTLCLGYEGLGQQIAYHYHKKLVTLSNWQQISRNTGGPKSLVTNDLEKVRKYVITNQQS